MNNPGFRGSCSAKVPPGEETLKRLELFPPGPVQQEVKGIEPAKKIALIAVASSDHARTSAGARLKTLPSMKSNEPMAKTTPIHQFNCRGIHRQRPNVAPTEIVSPGPGAVRSLRWCRERQIASERSRRRNVRRVTNGQGPIDSISSACLVVRSPDGRRRRCG